MPKCVTKLSLAFAFAAMAASTMGCMSYVKVEDGEAMQWALARAARNSLGLLIVGQIRASLGNILRLIESNHPIQTPEGVWIRL